MTVELPARVRAALVEATGGDDDTRELAEQAVGAVRYALDRALAHHANPQQFPLAAEDSLERRFLARVRRMPATSAAELAERARSRLAPTPAGASDATVAAERRAPTRDLRVRRRARTDPARGGPPCGAHGADSRSRCAPEPSGWRGLRRPPGPTPAAQGR